MVLLVSIGGNIYFYNENKTKNEEINILNETIYDMKNKTSDTTVSHNSREQHESFAEWTERQKEEGKLTESGEWIGSQSNENTTPQIYTNPNPQSGEIIYQKPSTLYNTTAPLEIITSDNYDYYLKLRNYHTGEEILSFYVRGGDTIELEVPLGNYELTYACGTIWCGTEYLFGDATVCQKANTMLSFYESGDYVYGSTLTLYPVTNGNMSTDIIDTSDF